MKDADVISQLSHDLLFLFLGQPVNTFELHYSQIILVSTSFTMASPFQDTSSPSNAYHDPTPMPANVPKVNELGTTSAPLKSAAFFIGAYCKEYNGVFPILHN